MHSEVAVTQKTLKKYTYYTWTFVIWGEIERQLWRRQFWNFESHQELYLIHDSIVLAYAMMSYMIVGQNFESHQELYEFMIPSCWLMPWCPICLWDKILKVTENYTNSWFHHVGSCHDVLYVCGTRVQMDLPVTICAYTQFFLFNFVNIFRLLFFKWIS